MTGRTLTRIVVCCCFIIAFISPHHSQSGRVRVPRTTDQTRPDVSSDTVQLSVEEVLLPVSIRSDLGTLPPRLNPADLIVLEDGKRQQITSVIRAPAHILIIIDTSGEVLSGKNFNVNRELAAELIDSLGDEDQAAIITYADKVNLIAPWSSDKTALQQALRAKFTIGIKSEFYQSLLYGANEVLAKVSGRRSVVLLSDGVDSFVRPDNRQALPALLQARATVYAVSQNEILQQKLKAEAYNKFSWYDRLDPRKRERIDRLRQYYLEIQSAQRRLAELAEATGGLVWSPQTWDEFKKVTPRVLSEIGTEYLISYTSQRPLNEQKFYPIQVFITRSDLRVRARRGVYSS